MAAGTFTLYNSVSEFLGDGTIDLDLNAFSITLHTSAFTPDAADSVYLDLNAELPTANGYTAGGAALTAVTWNRVGGVTTFDSADQVWTAAGGPITARYAVVRDTTANKLIGYMLLESPAADVTVTDGNTLTVGPSAANGWFTQSVNV